MLILPQLSWGEHSFAVMSSAGDCKAEVDQYCFEIKPGEGRLAKCLQQQLEEQAKAANSDPKITEACKQELDDFLIDRSGTITVCLTSSFAYDPPDTYAKL